MGLCGSKVLKDQAAPGTYDTRATHISRGSLTGVVKLQQGHEDGVLDVCSGAAGSPTQFFSCGEDRRILLHDYTTGGIVSSWSDAHESAVNRLTYIEACGLLASSSRDKTIRLWKPNSDAAVGSLNGHDLTVSAISATADGRRMASGSRDTTVRLWDLETQKQLYRGHKPQNLVTCLKWYDSAVGDAQNIIIQGAEDLRVRIWDTRVGIKEVQVLEGYVYFPLALDVSPCGRYLLTSSKGFNGVGGEARVWDLRGGSDASCPLMAEEFGRSRATLTRQYAGHVQDASACRFLTSPITIKGAAVNAFLTASKDGTIRLWDRDTGAVLHEHIDPSYGSFTSMTLLPNTADSKYQAIFATCTHGGSLYVYGIGGDGSFACVACTAVGETEQLAPMLPGRTAGVAI